jgi:hypothetical protein
MTNIMCVKVLGVLISVIGLALSAIGIFLCRSEKSLISMNRAGDKDKR